VLFFAKRIIFVKIAFSNRLRSRFFSFFSEQPVVVRTHDEKIAETGYS
jgi:hypothetical protein